MIDVVILDLTAESRQRILANLNELLHGEVAGSEALPRINLRAVSMSEIKYQQTHPTILIVGPELIENELTELAALRALFLETAILGLLPARSRSIQLIEQVSRMGADDLLHENSTPSDFLEKLIFAARRASTKQVGGKLLIVDSAKGGLGTTSITAALGECLVANGKRVCLVDLDFQSQDLSRFLGAKPYINENLQSLLAGGRITSDDFVRQCLVSLASEGDSFACLPPPPETESLYDSRSSITRTIVSVLEILDTLYDYVIVDSGAARGVMLKALYQHADQVFFLVSNDPASLFPSRDRLLKLSSEISPNARVRVIENGSQRGGLPNKFLRAEFTKALKTRNVEWGGIIGFDKNGSRWPGSAATLYSHSSQTTVHAIEQVLIASGLIEPKKQSRRASGVFSLKAFISMLSNLRALAPAKAARENVAVIELPAAQSMAHTAELPAAQLLLAQKSDKASTHAHDYTALATSTVLPFRAEILNASQNSEAVKADQREIVDDLDSEALVGNLRFS